MLFVNIAEMKHLNHLFSVFQPHNAHHLYNLSGLHTGRCFNVHLFNSLDDEVLLEVCSSLRLIMPPGTQNRSPRTQL